MTDFEAALRKAINTCYRGIRLHGCWFHYDRAIQKYVRKRPTLRNLLKNNADAKAIFKQLLSLPLLPEDKFEEGYNAIREKARQLHMLRRMFVLFRYFNSYWIRQVRLNLITYKFELARGRILSLSKSKSTSTSTSTSTWKNTEFRHWTAT